MKIVNYLLTALLVLNLVHVKAQCSATGSHYTTTASGWSPFVDLGDGVGTPSTSCGDGRNGNIFFWGTAAFFTTARDGREMRLSRNIPPLSDHNWTMDFMLNITPSQHGGGLQNNSPSVTLASLTTDQMNLKSGCIGVNFCNPCASYSNTNMDAIWVDLTSNAPSGCSENQANKDWRIIVYARDGNGTPISSGPIYIASGVNASYYIRVQRTNLSLGLISVYSNSDYTGHLPGSPQCFTIPGSVTGLDCLNHEVHSKESCQRVFNGNVDRMKIDNNVPCPTALHPSFTAPTSVCYRSLFTVNGSASTSGTSIPISSHMWAVEECDANGNHFGPVWYGGSIPGAPSGNYTINPFAVWANVNMQAGHYYKISLILQNCGNHWTPTSRVIYVNPKVTVSMSGSNIVTIPYNNQPNAWIKATGVGGSGSYTVNIYTGGFPPTSVSVLVSSDLLLPGDLPVGHLFLQTAPRNYYIEVIDNVTGCSDRRSWWVSMQGAKADFTVNATVNSGQFSLETHPVDVDLNNYDGFTYSHTIEELDEDGNSLYSHTSPDCWTNYPDFENFKGFTSTGTGTYEQDPGCSDPGQFLTEHRYRITTSIQATDIDETHYSVIVHVNKSGELVVEEDLEKSAKAVEHSAAHVVTSQISIHPNPSTGVFIIELEKTAEGSLIEVKNALGQKVKTLEAKGIRSELNLTGFTKGIYIVTISSNGNKTTKKIILE